MKNRPLDSDENVGILDEILMRGLPPTEAIPLVVDMLMAGIDTVNHLTCYSFSQLYLFIFYERPLTRPVFCFITLLEILINKRN